MQHQHLEQHITVVVPSRSSKLTHNMIIYSLHVLYVQPCLVYVQSLMSCMYSLVLYMCIFNVLYVQPCLVYVHL